LTVGSIKRRKGQLVGLQAFARLKDLIPCVRYQIVGSTQEEDYRRELVEFVHSTGLEDVAFLGRVSDDELALRFRAAAVLLVPSQQVGWKFEGFGLVCLEAGAFGVPVVGTRTGGIPDAVCHGETGFLVEPGDIEGLAGALRRIICDPALAARMGRSGRRWAETLTWDLCAERQFGIYLQKASQNCVIESTSTIEAAG
jgi:glycosyltransferase involved in cell wall biosynthesis